MQDFSITDHVEFNKSGRAQCPACASIGKDSRKTNLALVPGTDGAYKCHRGCTPEEIREALGKPKLAQVPSNLAKPKTINTLTQNQVENQHQDLLKSAKALPWLIDRGLPLEAIKHFKLGVARVMEGNRKLPCVAIPIPVEGENRFYQKKRVLPWDASYTGKPWSQYGIPAMFYFTHRPDNAHTLWLCEGEWDAIWLGWLMREQQSIAIATATCGAETIPAGITHDLADFKHVISFYDLDKSGQDGAVKLGKKLGKERFKAAIVPHPDTPPDKWDVSDALKAGFPLEEFEKAARYAKFPTEKHHNPLRDRLVSYRELLENAPDYTDWLVPDLMTSDELFLLAAPPRAGKSLLAMSLAQAVASGGHFLGRPCTQGGVVYIKLEDSDTKVKERTIAQGWDADLPIRFLDKFKFEELPYLAEVLEEMDIRLFVIDTLSRAKSSDIAENSAEMSQLLEPLQNLCRDKGIAGLIVHHTGKVPEGGKVDPFDTIRGSSAIRATCRGVWVLAPDDRSYRLCVENGWGKHDLKIRLDPDTLLWTLLGKWTPENVNQTQQEKVLDYLNKVVSTSIDVLNEVLDIPKSSLYVVLRRLQHEGIVHKRGSGVHSVYTRKSIEQIEQLNNLLDLCNADEARDRDGSNKNSKTLLDPQKSGQLPKSGQNSVHFSDSLSTPSTGDFVRSELDPLPDKEYSDLTNIEQGLNKDPKSGQSDQTDDPLAPIPVDPNVEYEEW